MDRREALDIAIDAMYRTIGSVSDADPTGPKRWKSGLQEAIHEMQVLRAEMEPRQVAGLGKVGALLTRYDESLAAHHVEPLELPSGVATPRTAHQHVRWMIGQIRERVVRDGWSERKLNRWLGFIQGVLFTTGDTTIPALRDDSRDLFPDIGARPNL